MLSGGVCCAASVHCSPSAFDTCLLCVWCLIRQSPSCLSQMQIEVRLRVIHYSKKMLGSCSQASSAKVIVPETPPPLRSLSHMSSWHCNWRPCCFLALSRTSLVLTRLCKHWEGSIDTFSVVLRLDLHSVVLSYASAAFLPCCDLSVLLDVAVDCSHQGNSVMLRAHSTASDTHTSKSCQ